MYYQSLGCWRPEARYSWSSSTWHLTFDGRDFHICKTTLKMCIKCYYLGTSDKTWSTGEGNDKPLQYSCLENSMDSMKRQKDRTLKDELPRSVGVQYATGEQWRNISRKNEETELKWKQYPVVHVTDDRSKLQCCKEKYCIGTWNARSLNQGK